MFRTVSLSIIRSFSLYTQQWYMSYSLLTSWKQDQDENQLDALISQIYFWNKSLHVSDNSSVHHQEFFTAHTAMVCHTVLLTSCEQDQDENELDALISQIYFWNKTLHVSDSFSVQNQEFFTVHTQQYIKVCWQPASCQQTCMTYTIVVCTVKNSWCWTQKLSETYRVLFQK